MNYAEEQLAALEGQNAASGTPAPGDVADQLRAEAAQLRAEVARLNEQLDQTSEKLRTARDRLHAMDQECQQQCEEIARLKAIIFDYIDATGFLVAGLEGMDEVETVLALPAVTETTLRLRRHRAILRTMAMDPWSAETDIIGKG